jgi:hypothetical protein
MTRFLASSLATVPTEFYLHIRRLPLSLSSPGRSGDFPEQPFGFLLQREDVGAYFGEDVDLFAGGWIG